MGPTPISEGLDSEIFDRTDFPYSETFVREAIQNSLDARIESSSHVRIDFRFHATECNSQRSLLRDVISYRKKCGLPIPEDWHSNQISWLVVQDFQATGLSGDLNRRTSDFWNYWLNFGQSNKDGSGRGGRGIGRVTFLIASQIQTVIGYTRRIIDKKTPICGMTVLRPIEDQSDFRSTHAYLAASEHQSIYRLHAGNNFYQTVTNGFNFDDYEAVSDTGLALAIPYPHQELKPESILAAAIENFAPTIMDGSLKLNVDGTQLDKDSISRIATKVSSNIREQSIKSDPQRYLSLINKGLSQSNPDYEIHLSDSAPNIDHRRHRPTVAKISQHFQERNSCVIDVSLPLRQNGDCTQTRLRAVAATAPEGVTPLDRFFRDGMCLPKVRSQDPRDFDLLFFAGDDLLAKYLNLCEGRAHLDLSRSKAITEKLRSNNFDRPFYKTRELIKSMPRDLRQSFYGDVSQPDARVFENFFSVSNPRPNRREPDSGQPMPPNPAPISNLKPFRISPLKKGLRVVAEKSFEQWPVDLYAVLAYADGSRRPNWNHADFQLEQLAVGHEGCEQFSVQANAVKARQCDRSFKLEITGFDSNRELIVSWRTTIDAQGD